MEETKEFVMYSEGNNNFDFEVEIGSLPPLSINPKYREFIVQNPTKNGSYITYNVVGCTNRDSRLEKFNLFKRYGDFEQLRELVTDRWIGFFIPAIPPKQAIVSTLYHKSNLMVCVQGNMDKEFILERKQMLNLFIRNLAKYEFLTESEEFGLFVQYSGD